MVISTTGRRGLSWQDTGDTMFKKMCESYFIAKPVRTRELITAIDKVLASHGG
ncbi:MAG: hypothetical protein ACLFQ9_04865 [Desulfobacterales bacterium]